MQIVSNEKQSIALNVWGDVYATINRRWSRFIPLYFGNRKIKTMDSGENHLLLLEKDGELYSYGIKNEYGELGRERKRNFNFNVWHISRFLQNKVRISSIACGKYHNLCIDDNQNVWSWGDNQYGQCGHGQNIKKMVIPTFIPAFEGRKITKIRTGGYHSYVATVHNEYYLFDHTIISTK